MMDFEIDVNPVETYKSLEIPTFGDKNPTLLKRLPSRWRANTKVLACMGVIGAFALSGCAPVPPRDPLAVSFRTEQVSYGGYSDVDIAIRLHVGGGGGLFYVVHLTEQEAFGIIQARLEVAGLDFSARVPRHSIGGRNSDLLWTRVSLDLFDEQKGVAVTNLNWLESNRPFSPSGRQFAMLVEREFSHLDTEMIVGAFYNPGVHLGSNFTRGEDGESVRREVSTDEAATWIPALKASLNFQADMFVAFLQSIGILELSEEVNVIINGERVTFDMHPVTVNNQVMVSSPEIFDVLKMEIISESFRDEIVATNDNFSIRICFGFNRHRMLISDSWLYIDTPAFMHNDKVLIPLQYLAEAIGASYEWDEDMKTIKVNTN